MVVEAPKVWIQTLWSVLNSDSLQIRSSRLPQSSTSGPAAQPLVHPCLRPPSSPRLPQAQAQAQPREFLGEGDVACWRYGTPSRMREGVCWGRPRNWGRRRKATLTPRHGPEAGPWRHGPEAGPWRHGPEAVSCEVQDAPVWSCRPCRARPSTPPPPCPASLPHRTPSARRPLAQQPGDHGTAAAAKGRAGACGAASVPPCAH